MCLTLDIHEPNQREYNMRLRFRGGTFVSLYILDLFQDMSGHIYVLSQLVSLLMPDKGVIVDGYTISIDLYVLVLVADYICK